MDQISAVTCFYSSRGLRAAVYLQKEQVRNHFKRPFFKLRFHAYDQANCVFWFQVDEPRTQLFRVAMLFPAGWLFVQVSHNSKPSCGFPEVKSFVLRNQDRYDITISTTEKNKTERDGKNPDAKMNTIQFNKRLIR